MPVASDRGTDAMQPSEAVALHAKARGVAASVYSSRESWDVLARTVDSAMLALAPMGGVLDLVINGNDALALQAAAGVLDRVGTFAQGTRCRVWNIALGDKANAWNQYLHHIAQPADLYVFIDGYARAAPASFGELARALETRSEALASTGLPTSGWSARTLAARLRKEGGLHGNLYALTPETVRQLRALEYRLPLGIYRTDPTLGAALSFGLGLHPREWQPKRRLAVAENARWETSALRWWRVADWRTHAKRLVLQGQGWLETAAVKNHYAEQQLPFESLPNTVRALVQGWMSGNPEQASQLLRDRRARLAWKRLQVDRDWGMAVLPPRMLLDISPERKAPAAAAA